MKQNTLEKREGAVRSRLSGIIYITQYYYFELFVVLLLWDELLRPFHVLYIRKPWKYKFKRSPPA